MFNVYLCFITDFKPLKKMPNKKVSFIENSCRRLKIKYFKNSWKVLEDRLTVEIMQNL